MAPGGVDNYVDELLKDGRQMRLGISLYKMQPEHCHANIARLWQQRIAGLETICMGYALDADGTFWREHWWGLSAHARIIETTVPRSRYFGIDFSGEDADGVATEILRKFQRNL